MSRALPIVLHGGRVQRDCGTCSLCCTVMAIAEIQKPRNQRCPNLSLLGRCKIYATKPDSCTAFSCLWRIGIIPRELQPERVHAVGDVNDAGDTIVFHVDPRFPDAHDRGHLKAFIETMATKINVIVVCGDVRIVYGPNKDDIEVIAEDIVKHGGVR